MSLRIPQQRVAIEREKAQIFIASTLGKVNDISGSHPFLMVPLVNKLSDLYTIEIYQPGQSIIRKTEKLDHYMVILKGGSIYHKKKSVICQQDIQNNR